MVVGCAGVMVAVEATGTPLPMVTVGDVCSAPRPVPSPGRTVKLHTSPLRAVPGGTVRASSRAGTGAPSRSHRSWLPASGSPSGSL